MQEWDGGGRRTWTDAARRGVCVCYVRRSRVALLRVLMFLLESKLSGSIAQAFRRNDRLPAGGGGRTYRESCRKYLDRVRERSTMKSDP